MARFYGFCILVGLFVTGFSVVPDTVEAGITLSTAAPGTTQTISVCLRPARWQGTEAIAASGCRTVSVTVTPERLLRAADGTHYQTECLDSPPSDTGGLALVPALCNNVVTAAPVQAGGVDTNDAADEPGVSSGLVTCGATGQQPCQACDVVTLVNSVVGWLVLILGTIAAIIIVIAGAKLVTAGGNQHAMQEAKSMITNMIIGYVIVLAGWLLIDTGLKALMNDDNYGVWNQIQCVDQPEPEYSPYVARVTASGANQTSFSSGEVTLNVAAITASGDVLTMVNTAARQAGITDPYVQNVFTALVMQESSLCRNKVGPSTRYGTAYGCGQMLLNTAQGLDPSATADRLINDDAYNLALSARFFSQQLRRYNGNVRLTLASYNGGDKANENSVVCPGQLSWECLQNEGYAQTRNYVSNILSVAGRL